MYVITPMISFWVYKKSTMNPVTPAPMNPMKITSATFMIELIPLEIVPVPPLTDVILLMKEAIIAVS